MDIPTYININYFHIHIYVKGNLFFLLDLSHTLFGGEGEGLCLLETLEVVLTVA
jgi:hypothetical protein